jgi:hypothetical protein
MFEVTLGSEKPLLATPDADEISLLAPKAPGMPLLGKLPVSEMGSFDLKPGAAGGISPLPGLPMLDFSRDVSGLNRSSPPHGMGTRLFGYARTHAKLLVMSGATVAIAGVAWMVFHAAAAGPEAVAGPARNAVASAQAPAASPTPAPVASAPALAVASPEPVAPPSDPAPSEKPEGVEAPAAPAENAVAPAEVAVAAGGASAPAAEAPPAAERTERAAPGAATEPAARPSSSRSTPSPRSEPAEPAPAAAAAEPVAAPIRPPPVAAPSVGGFDGTADFDQSAAMAALRQAAESAKRCPATDAPAGGVRVAVTFARSGTVSATQVEGPVAGTPLGDCVVAKFQAVHVPPFRGSVMTVRKTVMF